MRAGCGGAAGTVDAKVKGLSGLARVRNETRSLYSGWLVLAVLELAAAVEPAEAYRLPDLLGMREGAACRAGSAASTMPAGMAADLLDPSSTGDGRVDVITSATRLPGAPMPPSLPVLLRAKPSASGDDGRCDLLRRDLRRAVARNRTTKRVSVLSGLGAILVIGLLVLIGRRNRSAMRAAAENDFLTGLPNRRSVHRAYDRAAGTAVMSIALLDLDRFKDLNDRFGHAAGDEALRAFANTVRSNIRGTDVAARWGGEEFLLMLPDTERSEAAEIIDRMRQAASTITLQGAPDYRVTFSAGVAAIHGSGAPLNDVLARADAALYSAKVDGRDRTRFAVD